MTVESGAGGTGAPGNGASSDDSTIGAEDIARLNGMTVERAGAFARLAGSALVAAGAVGVLAWLWVSVRQQQMIDDGGGGFAFGGEAGPSLVDRIDAFVDYVVFLPWSAVAVGAGFGLRLAADYTTARVGGSLSGFAIGDPVPDGGLSHEPEQLEVDPFTGA
jgi:hypothetical protein